MSNTLNACACKWISLVSHQAINNTNGLLCLGLLHKRNFPELVVRLMASRQNCKKDEGPKCAPEKLKKSPCAKDKKKSVKENEAVKPIHPDCCRGTCIDTLPRFDDIYYRISDKTKREYQRTWVACPDWLIIPKKVCKFENYSLPPIKRRKRKSITARTHKGSVCKDDTPSNSKCQRIKLRGCRQLRLPPLCKKIKGPSNCQKMCAPCPSYSECKVPKLKPKTPSECRCHDSEPVCLTWLRVQRALKKY